MLSIRFRIPRIAVRAFFMDPDGNVELKRVERFYDRKTLDDLKNYPGLIWKVWAVREDAREGSGYYLFKTRHEAEVRAAYAKKFYWTKGMLHTRTQIHEVMEECSRYTKAPLDVPANPPFTPEQEYEVMHPQLQNPLKMIMEKKKILRGDK